MQAIDQCDSLDQAMSVSAVLLFDQINIMGVVFIKNGIIKHQTFVGRLNDIALDMLLNYLPGQLVPAQKTVDGFMTEILAAVGKVCHGVIWFEMPIKTGSSQLYLYQFNNFSFKFLICVLRKSYMKNL